MKVDLSEIIVNTYGPESRNPVPSAARAGGVSVTPGDPGKGAAGVVEATALARAITFDPKMRDQR
jgi:hypothetical protein